MILEEAFPVEARRSVKRVKHVKHVKRVRRGFRRTMAGFAEIAMANDRHSCRASGEAARHPLKARGSA
jgi:hypothetical protein